MIKKKVGKYLIDITHPEKLFFTGITKLDLVDYYSNISTAMLPLIKGRPLMMHRYPDGIFGESFYQKDAGAYFPDWIDQVDVPKKDGFNNYVVCNNKATLVYLATQGCLTPHIWQSKADNLNVPNRIVFDLDPSDNDFSKVIKVAKLLKGLLNKLGIEPFLMTTGSRGLHVVISLKRKDNFEVVKHFADACAHVMVENYPELVTTALRKEKRGSAVFIDTLRNQYGATAVAPFAVRAYESAPVATPIYWSDLDSKNFNSQKYNIANIFDYLKKKGNPWREFTRKAVSLDLKNAKIKKFTT